MQSDLEDSTDEILRLRSIIDCVHSWIVCSAITTDEDLMQSADYITRITGPEYIGDGNDVD